jgi:predicted nucleic acid-binding protein
VIAPRVIVVDASIALAIALKEPEGPLAAAAISDWTREHARIVVPAHFWLEVTNSLLRRRHLPGAAVLAVIHSIDLLRFDTLDLDRAALVLAIDLAERHRLTSYDAAYLALTISLDGSLVTFDDALRTAAGVRALHVGPTRLSETAAAYEHEVTWPNYKGASAFLAKLRAEAAASN